MKTSLFRIVPSEPQNLKTLQEDIEFFSARVKLLRSEMQRSMDEMHGYRGDDEVHRAVLLNSYNDAYWAFSREQDVLCTAVRRLI